MDPVQSIPEGHPINIMAEPSEAELKTMIREIVKTVDLEKTGVKKFTKLLAMKYGDIDLSHRVKLIKTTLTKIINEESSEDDEVDEESEEEDEEEVVPKAKGKGGGLATVKEISDKLAKFLGQGKQMARTEIVKALWVYIRDNNLQNPENKREIVLDKKMKAVFGCDTFTMVSMESTLFRTCFIVKRRLCLWN